MMHFSLLRFIAYHGKRDTEKSVMFCVKLREWIEGPNISMKCFIVQITILWQKYVGDTFCVDFYYSFLVQWQAVTIVAQKPVVIP